jgi:RND family efflux transporter MFP subunit
VPPESTRGPNIRDLESLRITRGGEPPRRRRLTPIALATLAFAVAAAAIYGLYAYTLGRPLEVETAPVTLMADAQQSPLLTGSGYVITRDKYITIGTKILGQIVEEPIEEGKHVKKGDLLARIDDRDYQAQLHQAVADRDLARANLKLAQVKAARERTLYNNGVASRDELDVTENALAVAQAALARAEASIDYARFNVSQCVVVSPISGVVLKKYREIGDTINYGGDIQAGGGTTDIAQLADIGDMRVEADISENDIAKVAMGMPAAVILDAYPERSFEAAVVKIYPEADRQKGTVKVEVKILRPEMEVVKPEMSAKVTFLARAAGSGRQPVVLAPKNAIVKSGGESFVWLVRDGIARRATLVTGREFEHGVEVKSGLEEGETVIVAPSAGLKDGQRVASRNST